MSRDRFEVGFTGEIVLAQSYLLAGAAGGGEDGGREGVGEVRLGRRIVTSRAMYDRCSRDCETRLERGGLDEIAVA